MNNNSNVSKNVFAGIVVMVGIVSALITLITIDYPETVNYGIYIYTIIDIVYFIACIVLGIGMIMGKKGVLAAGAVVAAAAFALKAYKVLMWIVNNLDYYRGMYGGFGWQLFYFIGIACGIVAFIMFACVFSHNLKKPLLVMLFIAAAVDFIFPFSYPIRFTYAFEEFMEYWIKGNLGIVSFIFMLIGAILYVLMDKKPEMAQFQSAPVNAYTPAQAQAAVPVQPRGFSAAPVSPYTSVQAQTPASTAFAPVQPQAPYTAPTPAFVPAQPQAPASPAAAPAQPQAPSAPEKSEAPAAAALNDADRFELLRKYEELVGEGVLSREEYDAKKAQLLK